MSVRRYGLRDPAPTREDVAENVRTMDDAGYERKTTEDVLGRQINRFPSPRRLSEKRVSFRRSMR